MAKTKMFSTRLPIATVDAIQQRAQMAGKSQSEALAALVSDALDMSGRSGLEARLAAAEATVQEQERIVRRHTGRATPRTKRMSLGMTLTEAMAVDKAAQAAGMTRSEFLRDRVFGRDGDRKPLPLKQAASPALPA